MEQQKQIEMTIPEYVVGVRQQFDALIGQMADNLMRCHYRVIELAARVQELESAAKTATPEDDGK